MAADPPFRRLRVYTFDPSLATKLDSALINQVVVNVPWESSLAPGPTGDYLEVIDFDPASDCFYAQSISTILGCLRKTGSHLRKGARSFINRWLTPLR